MKEEQSRKIALDLLEAVSAEDVNKIVESEELKSFFDNSSNWQPYGGRNKNWDSTSGQSSEAVGALAELIINSIDAILMKKAAIHGVKEGDADVPQSMVEAVKRFYPDILEGKIATMESSAKRKLAKESVLIGVKRASKALSHYPSYTIIDFGEGQNSTKFKDTFLSLSENNKEGIPFVQGRFNMGSTGSIMFCTQGDARNKSYKLIVSRRSLDSDGYWGWTLIRVREPGAREKNPVVEYFAPNKDIPKFSENAIRAFGMDGIGVVEAGTIVKLYEYAIGSAHSVDFGLYYALNTNLLECALPICIYDFDAKKQEKKSGLRQVGITDRIFSGMPQIIAEDDMNIDKRTFLVSQTNDNSLGKLRIYATGIKRLPDHIKNNPFRCFYTVNGQTQAKERASFFKQAKLDDLRNNLIVRIDCNAMNNMARAMIFQSNREQMIKGPLTDKLRKWVKESLNEDGGLRELARQIRNRRVVEVAEETEQGAELWKSLLKDNPEIGTLWGEGADINNPSTPVPPRGDNAFAGKKFPTVLKVIRPDGVLNLPINTYRYIECRTDAENEYLGRIIDQGEFVWQSDDNKLTYRQTLRDGKLKIKVNPYPGATIGKSVRISFGFLDSSRPNPLMESITVNFCQEEKTRKNPPGPDDPKPITHGPSSQLPHFQFVYKQDWADNEFDEESGARCSDSDKGMIVYVNGDNKHLHNYLRREVEESDQKHVRKMFLFGVGILTLSMYIKFSEKFKDDNGADWDEHIKQASSAISAYVITLIRGLSGRQ